MAQKQKETDSNPIRDTTVCKRKATATAIAAAAAMAEEGNVKHRPYQALSQLL